MNLIPPSNLLLKRNDRDCTRLCESIQRVFSNPIQEAKIKVLKSLVENFECIPFDTWFNTLKESVREKVQSDTSDRKVLIYEHADNDSSSSDSQVTSNMWIALLLVADTTIPFTGACDRTHISSMTGNTSFYVVDDAAYSGNQLVQTIASYTNAMNDSSVIHFIVGCATKYAHEKLSEICRESGKATFQSTMLLKTAKTLETNGHFTKEEYAKAIPSLMVPQNDDGEPDINDDDTDLVTELADTHFGTLSIQIPSFKIPDMNSTYEKLWKGKVIMSYVDQTPVVLKTIELGYQCYEPRDYKSAFYKDIIDIKRGLHFCAFLCE